MNLDRLVAGLDIGSAKTTAVIAEVVGDLPKHPTVNILGVGQSRTTGLRRGVVADIEETQRSISKALTDAERMAGARVETVYAGIAGEHVQAMTSTGIASVTGSEITRSDVDRANAVARAQAIPQDRELIHAIPQEYTVDKNQGIRDPIGMIGTRLETEMYLVTIGASPAMNLRKAVERAGYRVGELVLEPLASALSVLTEDEKELGVALVEMGAGTTDVAVFHEGKIRHLGTVNYGGINVTSDIVHGLGVTQADAERLKEQYGAAYEPLVKGSGEQIRLPSTGAQGDRQIPRDLLAHIIHQRTQEIFEIVLRDIEEAGLIQRLSAGVVVTGGAAAQPGTADLASDVFGTGARLGMPGEFLGGLADSVQSPRFATVTGLVQYGAHRVTIGTSTSKGRRLSLSGSTPSMDNLAARFKTWLQDFF
ncbi:MAG TPA: cell division protein FtsA [Gemmatimonadaceae bacterium]|nr:cell division protein FtsA [Gemmatimonadaceae bacterium]